MAGTCFRTSKKKRLTRGTGLSKNQLSKNTHTGKEIEQSSYKYTKNQKQYGALTDLARKHAIEARSPKANIKTKKNIEQEQPSRIHA